MEIFVSSVEAAAQANSIADLFLTLERARFLTRIDLNVKPSAYQGAIISDCELNQLRRIENVIRLGHIRRIGPEKSSSTTEPSPRHGTQ
jgi:hypothetical protein